MSKRLQVLMGERELRELRRVARRHGLTVAEWVRRALAEARARAEPSQDANRKLAAVRAAVCHAFPIANIDQLLAEIERGYGA
ncbi:MAG: antitoxin [Deltaproteobacteria bacterium RBG_16_71_12]|nr:MAG: antitoxin [Deltaproteobacteria bacterium RBG_16_71_12]